MDYLQFTIENLGDFGNLVVQVTGTQYDEHVEGMVLDELQHISLADNLLLDAWAEVVIDQLGGDTLDRLFASRVNLGEDDLVKQAQRIGKVLVEVAGTGVKMRLEDSRNLTVLIQLTDALGTLLDLLGMVGIVAEEDQTVVLDLEIEATVNTSIGLQAVAQLVGSTSCQLGHGHSGNTILDIDGYGLS